MDTAVSGLGLGEIHMPGLGEPINGLAGDLRYETLRTKSRHSPSHSSPPTLAPFAAKTASAAALPPTATTPRKFSLQPSSAYSHDSISYPMIVSRSDMAGSTFSPHAPPPPPAESASRVDAAYSPTSEVADGLQQNRKGSKVRPAPIKISGSNHSTFLAPLLERPFMKRLGSKEKETEKEEGKEKSPTKSKSRKNSKVDSMLVDPQAILVENQLAFAEHYPPLAEATGASSLDSAEKSTATSSARKDSGNASPSAGPSAPTQNISPRVDRVPVPLIDSESPRSSPRATPTPATRRPPTHSHRRAMSDESPRLKQEATFPRAFGDGAVSARDRPFTTFQPFVPSSPVREAQRVRKGSVPSAGRTLHEATHTHGHSRSLSATAPKLNKSRTEDAFFAPTSTPTSTLPLLSPNSLPLLSPATRRPSATPRPLDSSNSIGISVRGSAASGSSSREVARAPLGGSEGVTVTLQSPYRPEDVEVGWICTSGVDGNGAPYTQWSITLKPKAIPAPLSAPNSTRNGSSFSSYRLSSSTARPTSISDTSRSRSGGESISPLDNSSEPPQIPIPPVSSSSQPRKPSAASSNSQPPTSDSQPSGSSISSESSGPTTPRRGKFGSIDSTADSMSSLDLSCATGTAKTLLMGKSRSYNNVAEQYRARQLSLESSEGGNSSRNGSIDSNASNTSAGPPKALRFGKYSPAGMPLGATGVEGFGVMLDGTDEGDEEDDEEPALAPFDSLVEPKTPTRSTTFVNIVPPTPDHSLIPSTKMSTPSSLDHIEAGLTSDEDEEDAGRRAAAKALARGKQRMMSKWSDTEGESEAEEADGTSWSTTPDGVEEDLSVH